MEQNELVAVCLSIVFVFLYIPGIFFLFGKGGLSIGGYHYTASSEKGKYFHKIILRRAGVFYIILIGLIHACILTGILGKPVACYTLIPITVVLYRIPKCVALLKWNYVVLFLKTSPKYRP